MINARDQPPGWNDSTLWSRAKAADVSGLGDWEFIGILWEPLELGAGPRPKSPNFRKTLEQLCCALPVKPDPAHAPDLQYLRDHIKSASSAEHLCQNPAPTVHFRNPTLVNSMIPGAF
jgi:hypothetical protein